MRRLAVYLKQYRRESILAPAFKLLEVVFDLLVPVVVARMIDSGAAGGNAGAVWLSFGGLLAMAAVGLGCTVAAQYFAAGASAGFAGTLRQALFDHVQSLSYTELDALGGDTLITRLTSDVNQIQTGLNLGLRLLLRSPLIVLGSIVMAFTINPRCALVFAVTVPVLFAVVYFIMRVSIPLFGRVQSGLDRVTAQTRENLTGVRVIRAFCREEKSVEEFEESSRGLTRLNLFVGRISALLNPLTYVLVNIGAVVLIRQAAVQVNLGNLPQGQVVALYNYMLQIIVELVKLASLIITLNKSAACAGRVAGVLAAEPGMRWPEEGTDSPGGRAPAEAGGALTPAVEFRNVSFTYRGAGAPSLSGISFSVLPGQTVGVIGGTGSGKTTLVSLIPRFYDPDSGSVLLDGKPAPDWPRRTLCRKIGVVPQRAALFSGTVRENLRWGDESADDAALWQALELAQAREMVEGKPGGLDFRLEQNGRNLSGGQRQRLTIARALVGTPELLILDDSSSALDYATDAALRRALSGLGGKTTVFLVSQRIACVRQADLILVLDNGRLAGAGTHGELLESCGVYREIYWSQFPDERPAAGKGRSGPAGGEDVSAPAPEQGPTAPDAEIPVHDGKEA